MHGLRDWKILKEAATQDEAQAYEDAYAKKFGCEAHAGGAPADGPWYVYYFYYTRKRNGVKIDF